MKRVDCHGFGTRPKLGDMQKNTQTTVLLLFCLIFVIFADTRAWAADERLTVGVAANFAPALEKIVPLFTRQTGISVQVAVSSSGRLYAQIRNRAPFDLFFSADKQRPELLYQDGYCEEPVAYVRGSVVLWSRNATLCRQVDRWQDAFGGMQPKKIGMANPELAPYGAAARAALVDEKLLTAVQGRLIFGTNVAQSFQYAATGATGGSFVALSLARTPTGEQGCTLPMPEAEPIIQNACVTAGSKRKHAARKFLNFLQSMQIQKILAASGYLIAEN